jgi:hypothetical protein
MRSDSFRALLRPMIDRLTVIFETPPSALLLRRVARETATLLILGLEDQCSGKSR